MGNFDEANGDANKESLNVNENEEDKVQINEDKMDDFDNWDHDPFADEDLFETNEQNGHSKNGENLKKDEKENDKIDENSNQNDEKIKSKEESSIDSVSKIKEKMIDDGQAEKQQKQPQEQQTMVTVND